MSHNRVWEPFYHTLMCKKFFLSFSRLPACPTLALIPIYASNTDLVPIESANLVWSGAYLTCQGSRFGDRSVVLSCNSWYTLCSS
jgi:hypothetical protein